MPIAYDDCLVTTTRVVFSEAPEKCTLCISKFRDFRHTFAAGRRSNSNTPNRRLIALIAAPLCSCSIMAGEIGARGPENLTGRLFL